MIRRAVTCVVLFGLMLQWPGAASACGPPYFGTIFVFEESPDLPFTEFVGGKIGIVRPTFGRKTLFIAYRYLNGGAFTPEEQAGLVDALRGKPPEDEGEEALEAWVKARQEIFANEKEPPEIYREREYGGYDFFPNCTKNAFEVAQATLKDRASTHGADDRHVRAWLAAQDLVFQNCQSGGALPPELGPESPAWLRKDRDYQIAAALLYSLNFDDARARFIRIANDPESPWRETAEYLVGRTLVRQASLSRDEPRKLKLYETAEQQLVMIAARRGKFSDAAHKLLALIKYRVRPDERVRELAAGLANQSGNDNLKQDLIDYVWLLDKIEDRVLKEEEKRRKALSGQADDEKPDGWESKEAKERFEAVQRGELIEIYWTPPRLDGRSEYTPGIRLDFEPTTTWPEVRLAFEKWLGRPLLPEEQKEIEERHSQALKHRQDLISPNRSYSRAGLTEYTGCDYECERLTLDLVPLFLRADDLSDWMLAMQTPDPGAYRYALTKWRETKSVAWLVVAITKADVSSPQLNRLLEAAGKVNRDSPAFASIAYHQIRLEIAMGARPRARKQLDEIVLPDAEQFPRSTQNLFLEQRMHLADTLDDFLKFARRKPAAFYEESGLGSIQDLIRKSKSHWDSYARYVLPRLTLDQRQTREQYENEIEESYRDLLPWDDRYQIDDGAVEILNWHFPLDELETAARNPIIPDYLRRRLMLALWTRAVVLRNDPIAQRTAPALIDLAPETEPMVKTYLAAETPSDREHAALFMLLKFPMLTPLIDNGLPESRDFGGDSGYYFQTSWWCPPSNTEYSLKESREVPKVVRKPPFLSSAQLERARQERSALIEIGDAKSYLGKRVIEWANQEPDDPRIPEALFITFMANASYKYGCSGWSHDEETQAQAAAMLRERYPNSPWTERLRAEDQ